MHRLLNTAEDWRWKATAPGRQPFQSAAAYLKKGKGWATIRSATTDARTIMFRVFTGLFRDAGRNQKTGTDR